MVGQRIGGDGGMNQDRLKLWLDALRSGEYKQSTRYLGTGDGYCCLGVLCEVAIKSGAPVKREQTAHGGVIRYDGLPAYPPTSVMIWLEHPTGEEVRVSHKTATGSLANEVAVAELNDSWRWNFNEIADALEATYGVKEEVPA